LVPSFDSGDDLGGIFCPNEGAWFRIGIGGEAIDGIFEVLHGTKDPAPEAMLGKRCEQTFDGVEPGCRGQRKRNEAPAYLGNPGQSSNSSLT
jgi:hypothetical protein